MVGKTVLFTGASRGVGRAAAIEMARRGAEILIVGHDEARGASVLSTVRTVGRGEFLLADMANAASVRQLAGRVLARTAGLHVLVHNAGGFPPAGRRTTEGVDESYALNFLGSWLLTRLLEEKLLASAPARVIAVSSEAHRMVKRFRLDALVSPGTMLSQMEAYNMAKLALCPWIYGLARRWADRGITANVLDPGWVMTEMGAQFEGPALQRGLMSTINRLFGVSHEKGSEQYLKLACDPALAETSGRYFASGREKDSLQLTHDASLARRIEEHAEAWAAPFLIGRNPSAIDYRRDRRDRLTRTGEEITDELFERLRGHFDDDQIVELTMIVAWENASSKFNHALGVPSRHLWRRGS
jgi:NAD(P)-dependent dehydrogenase (short-subunit alcohol dehydrogenase family)